MGACCLLWQRLYIHYHRCREIQRAQVYADFVFDVDPDVTPRWDPATTKVDLVQKLSSYTILAISQPSI